MNPYYQDDAVTIYHADCRDLLPLECDAVVTDPPYGTGCAPRGGLTAGSIDLGSALSPEWDTYDPSWVDALDMPLAVFCGQSSVFSLADRMGADGLLVYVKSNPNPMGSSYEPCLTRDFPHPRGRQHFVAYNAANGQQHPTQKPLDLMCWVVGLAPDGTILDPFMGSGTTLRAAKDLNRKAIGIEIEEKYCEIAARRMQQEVLAL